MFNTWMPKHLAAAWAGGVTTIVVSPMGSNLVAGVSVAFLSHGLTIDDALVKDVVGLHIHLGNAAKGSQYTSSVSGQFAQLRSLFLAANGTGSNMELALQGIIPVVAHVNQADQIASMIRMKKQFGFKLVILGGAEAHLVTKLIASEPDVSVIWIRSAPSSFETWQASVQTPGILDAAGIQVAIAIADPGNPRNLRWEAGIAVSNGMDYNQALAAITSVPAAILGLPNAGTIQENFPANFVAFDGDPFAIASNIQILATGTFVQCEPHQV